MEKEKKIPTIDEYMENVLGKMYEMWKLFDTVKGNLGFAEAVTIVSFAEDMESFTKDAKEIAVEARAVADRLLEQNKYPNRTGQKTVSVTKLTHL